MSTIAGISCQFNNLERYMKIWKCFRRKLRDFIIMGFWTCLSGLLLCGSAMANYEDAMAAYTKGDFLAAFKEFTPYAEQGMADAQFNIGFMYSTGKGVTQDYAEAVTWYHKAADQNLAVAQSELGYLYFKGRGVDKDYTKSVYWLHKAAEQGLAEAQYRLSSLISNGLGVDKNDAQGLAWLKKAAAQGHAEAEMLMALRASNLVTKSSIDSSGQENKRRPAAQSDIQATLGEMVAITGGEFIMGSVDGHWKGYEAPAHSVSVPSFSMGKYEVTFEQYDLFAGDTGQKFPIDKWGRGKHPVIKVSWDDATAYAHWLSEKTGDKYRLPTEAEWEYAARAGTTTKYYWGNEIGPNLANCSGCKSQWDGVGTAPVGSFSANPFELHDMSGNVWEWVEDTFHKTYEGAPADGSAWVSKDENKRVLRGGSWNDKPKASRSSSRSTYYGMSRISRSNGVGFRLVKTE